MICRLRHPNVGPEFIAPGRPGQNGYLESFHGKLRDEFRNRELLRDVRKARVIIERWGSFCNHQRPRSALGYRAPAQAQQAGPKSANIDVRFTA